MEQCNKNPLERDRQIYETEDFIKIFIESLEKNTNRAIGHLNHSSLNFATLYILMDKIKSLEVNSKMNIRNITAIKCCKGILDGKQTHQILKVTSKKKLHQVLLWIFNTGIKEDGLDDEYDKIIDVASSLLVLEYGDYTILPKMGDLIFCRNKKGTLIHDLVWVFFKSQQPITRLIIEKYLDTNDTNHIELACKLLHFKPSSDVKIQNYYESYKKWFDENKDYIYFSGESLQLTSDPEIYKVNLNAKYLHKKISLIKGEPFKTLNKTEKENLQQFYHINQNEKHILADYSYSLYSKSIKAWNRWLKYDIEDQIKTAINSLEGRK